MGQRSRQTRALNRMANDKCGKWQEVKHKSRKKRNVVAMRTTVDAVTIIYRKYTINTRFDVTAASVPSSCLYSPYVLPRADAGIAATTV